VATWAGRRQARLAVMFGVQAELTMVTMAAKWAGKCRLCGQPLPVGSQIDWTKDGGARHLTVEECTAARAALGPGLPFEAPVDPVDRTETGEDRLRAMRLLLGVKWTFAKTMAHIPHEWSLRRHWPSDSDFVWVVLHMRRVGEVRRFGSARYTYYDLAEHMYWTMGCDAQSSDPKTGTILINRAVHP
jgi:hypothetical protein